MRATISALFLAVLSAGQLVAPPSASADVTTLCWGYTGCAQQGMGDGGYGRSSGSMYWRMYAGHNCTNYVAFRMIQSGMPNVRPWEGSGNATYWGTSMPKITDSTPTVGSVAWWKAGVYPAGSAGHVAYVEKVVDSNTIIVSQDSWGGEFSWARITRDRGWPSGFIHFNDLALTKTASPTITGTPKAGATLTATPGSWSPAADVGYSYQWLADGVEVPGATRSTFALGEAQVGRHMRVRVTASKDGYPTATATSARTAAVLAGTLTNSDAPSISGAPVVEGTLTATPGRWEPAPGAVTYQWRADGVDVPGATRSTFTPGRAQLGQHLRVRVTATKAGYPTATATSVRTAKVRLGTFTNDTPPGVSGAPVVDGTLTATEGTWSPAPTAVTVQWLADGEPISGATGEQLTPGPELVGAELSVKVTATRNGYVDASVTSPATEPVRHAQFSSAGQPVISGTTRLGETLQLDPGTTAPEGSPTIQWQRGRQIVRDAGGTSYLLTVDDLGQKFYGRVRWERDGYLSEETLTTATTRVKATPTLEVLLHPGARGLRIRTDVLVPEQASLPERVKVRTGRIRESVPLVDGRAVTVLTGLRPGTRTVRIVVPPTRTVAATVWTGEVTIPKR